MTLRPRAAISWSGGKDSLAAVAAQVARLGLRSVTARCSWSTYDGVFTDSLRVLAREGITHIVFGDLVYPEHREWAEARCADAGVSAVEPLFGISMSTLFDAFVASGATALMVTVREPWLDRSWLGRPLSAGMKDVFAARGIDPGGERGECHTAVVDSPLFSHAVAVTHGERVRRGECVALDLIPNVLIPDPLIPDAPGH